MPKLHVIVQRLRAAALTIALALTIAASSAAPARAQVGSVVFDPTAYGNLIKQLAAQTTMTTQSAQQIQLLLQTYQNQLVQGTVHIPELWPSIQPALATLSQNLSAGPSISMGAADALTQFQAAYPQYTPNLPYSAMLSLWRQNAQNGIVGSLRVAQAIDQDLAAKSVSVQTLVSQTTPQGQMDALRVGNMLAQLNAQQMDGLRGVLEQQMTSQANFYSLYLQKNYQDKTNPGQQTLDSVFSQVPTQLRQGATPAAAPTPASGN